MKELNNECLKKYTTVKIGGIAEKMYFPENREELIKIFEKIKNGKKYIIGGGSNLLINDDKIFKNVISLKLLDSSIRNLGDGKYYVGASVSLQKMISRINNEGYGGIEYLFSVPALIGGAIAMNAGRGKKYNESISDYIKKIEVYDYDKGKTIIFKKEECEFSYRQSLFKGGKMVVLGAFFKFPNANKNETKVKRENRIEYVKKFQDNRGYSFGSIFREYNRYIMQIFRMFRIGNRKKIGYSKKTSNWLINKGEGSYFQAIKLINKAVIVHRFFRQKIILEVINWD